MSDVRRVTRRLGLRTAVAAAVTVPLLGTVSASAGRGGGGGGGDHPLDVMTFNLRFASTAEPHSWATRRPVMRELLRRAAPDVIGTQEGLYPQVRDIASDLGGRYDWIGTGRAGGSRDEFVAVFYDTERLAPAEYDHFWLSDTPEVIASNTWGGSHVRMVTWVRFRDLRAGGREFYVLNTHLDSGSQYARVRAAGLIGQRIAGLDRALPVVVTGDFNSAAHRNPVYDTMLDAGLVDTWDTAAERGAPYATFHGYRPLVPDGDRIDWILTSPGVRAVRTAVDT
ncbi:endonuclease/exonuclease/phosphatase family protein, partial [Streptomyces sp. NPDC059466]